MVMCVKLSHSSKQQYSNVVTDAGIVNSFNFLQPRNHLLPIDVKFAGSFIVVKFLHPQKQ